MDVENWKTYYKTARPTTAPHELVDVTAISNGSIWKMGKPQNRPWLARWTSQFDCGYETEWWYCIKDQPFSLSDSKAKKRYYIKKGIENFDIRIIDPTNYLEDMLLVALDAYRSYTDTPSISKGKYINETLSRTDLVTFGAFDKEDPELLCGVL